MMMMLLLLLLLSCDFNENWSISVNFYNKFTNNIFHENRPPILELREFLDFRSGSVEFFLFHGVWRHVTE